MTTPIGPGWHPDPHAPASLQRYWDGERWTDDSRPTGYVTQPGGPPPVGVPATETTPMFGAAPPEVEGLAGARRRMSIAVTTLAVLAGLAVLALVLALAGVL